MVTRVVGLLVLTLLLWCPASWAQASGNTEKEPVSDGRTLSEWVADLKAAAPETRNAAAYEIAGMGPAAAAAVPALIEALEDPIAAVRFPVTVALGEIGPGAEAAVPRLKQMMEEEINDEIAAGARRAIRRIKPEALRNR
ncbi:MAG: HEAT repeat domain-containing protein, partial [Gemmatimonadales bacterium]